VRRDRGQLAFASAGSAGVSEVSTDVGSADGRVAARVLSLTAPAMVVE
jgi:hypothetical protein